MKLPFKLLPLFFCFLLSFCSLVRADHTQKDFAFLKDYKNASSMVESDLAWLESTTGFSLSILVNLGFWYGVCKTLAIVSGLASSEKKGLTTLKTDFCMQLASVITTTEVALAGHVCPWSLEQIWWQPLRFAGAGMAAYAGYTVPGNKLAMPVPVASLTYFTAEAIARTAGSTASSIVLRKADSTNIDPFNYDYGQYVILSIITGLMAGGVVYETSIKIGLSPATAALAFVISTSLVAVTSAVVSTSVLDMNGQLVVMMVAGAGIAAGVAAGVNARAITGAGAGAGAVAENLAEVGAIAGPIAVAVAVAAAGTGTEAGVGVVGLSLAGVVAGTATAVLSVTGAVAGGLLTLASSETAANYPVSKITKTSVVIVTLAFALGVGLFNSLGHYAVYGTPVENSLSETVWTLWKKFYAPLDYFTTVFD